MTTPRDPDTLLVAYLADGMEVLPDRVVDAVLDEVHRTRQRAVFGPWRTRSMFKTALRAAAVFAVLVLGGTFLMIQRGQPAVVGGPSPTPAIASPTSAANASPSAVPSPSVVPARAPSWTATGRMGTPRGEHTATLLPDGKVLVAGGAIGGAIDGGYLASAELYDPGSGAWTATGSMTIARGGYTATLLPDGKVLVAGGGHVDTDGTLVPQASAELYDPDTGTWTATRSMAQARFGPTATLLLDGEVLVAGGFGDKGVLASAELYDPDTGTWTATGSMTIARGGYPATLLPDGKVLVAGGYVDDTHGNAVPQASAELYDPDTGTWTATGSMAIARGGYTATLLPDGKVLVAGGYVDDTHGNAVPQASAELYDPDTGTWTATGSMAQARFGPTATLLLDGEVLVAGGFGDIDGGYLASAELYDPGSGAWTATGSMGTPRMGHTATLLPDGKVLVAGDGGYLASAELYDPDTGTWTATGSMTIARGGYTATLLPDGKVLVAGGYVDDTHGNAVPQASAELYDPGSP